MSFLPLVRIWIVVAALAGAAGWILSALGQLNRTGYGIFAALAVVCFFRSRHELLREWKKISRKRMQARFSRPLPLGLAALAALVLAGGALYPPTNFDALTYRLPRVLHWLAQGQWHWIHTADYRMNDRSCGFEWLMAPLLLATKSDRALFLINFLPFLLLPGLVFSVFTRLGVNTRVAWHWMWLLPTGYNFLLQAGSLGNDAFAAPFALAAVDFSLRAAASRRISDIWLSLLAAALLTGAKPGNLPLLLPWFILFVPLAPRLFAQPIASLAVILLALLASFLPTALFNSLNCGDWTGLSLENSVIAMRNPVVGILGNSVMLLLSNVVPTFFPLAGWWNHSALTLLPGKITALLAAQFEGGFYRLGEIPTEEWAGLGFGLSCLLAVTVLTAWLKRPRQPSPFFTWPQGAALAAPYLALLFFFAKSGMMTLARLVSAYYPLLLPALLCGSAPAGLVRRVWWRRAELAVMLLALAALALTPARPLWPARTVLATLDKAAPNHPFIKRIKETYSVYANRSDPLARVRAALPDNSAVIGFAGVCDEMELSLWRPYGQRRVEDIVAGESAQQIRARQIQYAVVGELFLSNQHHTIQTWVQVERATLVTSIFATVTVSDGPRLWHVVRFDPIQTDDRQKPPAHPQ